MAQITEGTDTSTLPGHQIWSVIWNTLNEGKGHNGQVSMKKVLMELVAQHIVRNWPSEAGDGKPGGPSSQACPGTHKSRRNYRR